MNSYGDREMTQLVGNAVTVSGKIWAYRMHYPNGQYVQWEPDMTTMRAKWYGDIMQYFNPIARA